MLATIAWEGDSKEVISSFPDSAKASLGFDLRLLQQGEQPTNYRPMGSVGPEFLSCGIKMSELGIV
jgi:phage-related protein